ncbi:TfoX/Sxy family protein [Candidatus Gracilibacteria bacterium]|nr:TfoX/Sxy family protein [Candidatus Gracilibacteria bacterium]
MAASQEYTDYILELLSEIQNISTHRMFGGVLLKVDGQQLGVLFKENLYFKVTTESLQEEFAQQGSTQFSYTRKDKATPVIIKNWWRVPDSYLDNSSEITKLALKVLAQ